MYTEYYVKGSMFKNYETKVINNGHQWNKNTHEYSDSISRDLYQKYKNDY